MPQLVELLIYFMIFAVATLIALTWIQAADRRMRIFDRLEPAAASEARGDMLVKQGQVKNPLLAWIRSQTLVKSGEEDKLRRKLALAGFDHPSAPVWYVLARLGLAIAPALMLAFAQSVSGKSENGSFAILAPAFLCLLGFLAPQAIIDNLASSRKDKLIQQFPDVLDLLVICVEAGTGLESALVRVASDTNKSHPDISRQLVHLSQEVSAGRPRDEALHAMAERTDLDMVRSFASVVAQSDALGVSIGQTLRTFAVEMRETRYLNAEEKAMRIPVLMTIPLVACILPVIITSLLLPAVIDVIRVIGPALAS
jgi:tight adherence protein C